VTLSKNGSLAIGSSAGFSLYSIGWMGII
jgi:hypothetical protein